MAGEAGGATVRSDEDCSYGAITGGTGPMLASWTCGAAAGTFEKDGTGACGATLRLMEFGRLSAGRSSEAIITGAGAVDL